MEELDLSCLRPGQGAWTYLMASKIHFLSSFLQGWVLLRQLEFNCVLCLSSELILLLLLLLLSHFSRV